jgi:hypothetical protein
VRVSRTGFQPTRAALRAAARRACRRAWGERTRAVGIQRRVMIRLVIAAALATVAIVATPAAASAHSCGNGDPPIRASSRDLVRFGRAHCQPRLRRAAAAARAQAHDPRPLARDPRALPDPARAPGQPRHRHWPPRDLGALLLRRQLSGAGGDRGPHRHDRVHLRHSWCATVATGEHPAAPLTDAQMGVAPPLEDLA